MVSDLPVCRVSAAHPVHHQVWQRVHEEEQQQGCSREHTEQRRRGRAATRLLQRTHRTAATRKSSNKVAPENTQNSGDEEEQQKGCSREHTEQRRGVLKSYSATHDEHRRLLHGAHCQVLLSHGNWSMNKRLSLTSYKQIRPLEVQRVWAHAEFHLGVLNEESEVPSRVQEHLPVRAWRRSPQKLTIFSKNDA